MRRNLRVGTGVQEQHPGGTECEGEARMATYVLLHGSYQGGWIWQPVGKRLTAAGNSVYRPTLDRSAGRKANLRPHLSMKEHGAEIANLLFHEDFSDEVR